MPCKRNIEPFATLGADIKKARLALRYTQKSLAEKLGIDPRYLANIENSGKIPSLPILYSIVITLKLPVEQYFHTDINTQRESPERERVNLKLKACPEKYLSIIEGTIDAITMFDEAERK